VAKAAFPAASLQEMIAWMRANPGKATVGAVGVGGPTDIAAIYFQKQTGTSFQLVPYRGGAPLVPDLVAGPVDLTFGQAANYLAHVRGGRLKAYAVLAGKRWWAAPDVPTMDEAGVPGQGHAEGCRRQAPRRGGGRAGRSGIGQALRRHRPGNLATRP